MFHINVKPYQKAIVKFRQPAYSNVFQQSRRTARISLVGKEWILRLANEVYSFLVRMLFKWLDDVSTMWHTFCHLANIQWQILESHVTFMLHLLESSIGMHHGMSSWWQLSCKYLLLHFSGVNCFWKVSFFEISPNLRKRVSVHSIQKSVHFECPKFLV